MKLLGAPAGGILVAWGGPVAVMLVDAATFLVIAAVLLLVVRPRFRLPRAAHDRWRDSFTDGMRYLRSHETAKLFVIGLTALNVFVTPVTGLGVALRVSGSGWGAHWLGIADASLAAGAIVGSVVAHPLAADVRRGRGLPGADRPGPGDRRRRAGLEADPRGLDGACSASPPAPRRCG